MCGCLAPDRANDESPDDFLHADKVRAQLGGVPALENADVIYSPVLREIWDAHGPRSLSEEPIDRTADVFAQYLSWQLPQTGAALWRRSTMENIGGWNEDPATGTSLP